LTLKDNKLTGLILTVAGAILLFFGWQSSESLGEQLTETFTGRFTDQTMILIIGGAVCLAAGLYLVVQRK
jgi:drug/metabolite transporter (DMT)-like permease